MGNEKRTPRQLFQKVYAEDSLVGIEHDIHTEINDFLLDQGIKYGGCAGLFTVTVEYEEQEEE